MSEPIKIIIPMAGYGSRMRPHTWSKPKPLSPLAGKRVLDHLLAMFITLPDVEQARFVFILSPNQGPDQVYGRVPAAAHDPAAALQTGPRRHVLFRGGDGSDPLRDQRARSEGDAPGWRCLTRAALGWRR